MRYPSIDKLLTQVGSKYLLVNVVAARAKEIADNEFYQMRECDYKSAKPLGRALEEIAANLVRIKEDDEKKES